MQNKNIAELKRNVLGADFCAEQGKYTHSH